ncbi:MAG TPA: nuclear transport factor 2 family protein [Pyrinomonadaceae bacterium]|nr:nuclear transport factor 2 family protein [Pyrinomonadaceae bacterium]
MMFKLLSSLALAAALAPAAAAQNANANTAPAQDAGATPSRPTARGRQTTAPRTAPAASDAAQRRAVEDAFDALIDGIRRADAAAVMEVYWNSPRLVLFNNNGTVTRTWEQSRANRESIYARVKNVKLDVRDVSVELLGRDGAVVSALWEQSQTADGQPERASGRMTLVFRRAGTAWKVVHAHTSPDRPDPARLFPSERTGEAPAQRP